METVTKHIPVILLVGVVCRTLALGTQIADSLVIVGLCGLIYLLANIKYNKQATQVQEELAKLRADLANHREEISETKSYVSGVKMATSLSGKR